MTITSATTEKQVAFLHWHSELPVRTIAWTVHTAYMKQPCPGPCGWYVQAQLCWTLDFILHGAEWEGWEKMNQGRKRRLSSWDYALWTCTSSCWSLLKWMGWCTSSRPFHVTRLQEQAKSCFYHHCWNRQFCTWRLTTLGCFGHVYPNACLLINLVGRSTVRHCQVCHGLRKMLKEKFLSEGHTIFLEGVQLSMKLLWFM